VKLYKLNLSWKRLGWSDFTIFLLAETDLDFLGQVEWLFPCRKKEEPDPGQDKAALERVTRYHEDMASYHQLMAAALRGEEFEVVDEGKASFTSREVSETEIAELKRLGIIED